MLTILGFIAILLGTVIAVGNVNTYTTNPVTV